MNNSIEAEQAVLSCLILYEDLQKEIIGKVTAEHFYQPDHQVIFKAALQLEKIDFITVIEKTNLAELVTSLAESNERKDLLNNYISILEDKRKIRTLINGFQEASDAVFTTGVSDGIGKINNVIAGLLDGNSKGMITGKEQIKIYRDHLEQVLNNPQQGISTGFPSLDRASGGLMSGKVYVVAGRPSMGKSVVALNMAEEVSKQKPCLFFSLEMPIEDVIQRRVSSLGGINNERVKDGRMSGDEGVHMNSAAAQIFNNKNLVVDCTPAVTLEYIRSQAHAFKAQHEDLGAIFIDHCLLMSHSEKDDYSGLTNISHGFVALAKELNCAIVAVLQLNRGVESRIDKRPMMSDLKQTGAWEEDAHLVMMCYRDDYYNEDSEYKGQAELIIRKNRGGAAFTFYCASQLQYYRFKELVSNETLN